MLLWLIQKCVEVVVAVNACVEYLAAGCNGRVLMTDIRSLPQCAVVLIEQSYTHCKVIAVYYLLSYVS